MKSSPQSVRVFIPGLIVTLLILLVIAGSDRLTAVRSAADFQSPSRAAKAPLSVATSGSASRFGDAGNPGFFAASGAGKLGARVVPVSLAMRPGAGFFATRTVTNGNNSGAGSLRDTIAAAAAGDTIVFSGVTTVTLTSDELLIDKDLTINGGVAGVTITRSGGTQFRIFNIAGGVSVALNRLTISNGNHPSQAGGIQNSGDLTMTDCAVTGNTSGQAGGVQNDGVITMTNCTVSNNTSTSVGGGFVSFGTSNTLTNCTVSNNQANSHGGGISLSSGSLTMTHCTVAGNQSSSGSGGGIHVGGTALLRNTLVATNTASTQANLGGNAVDPASSYNYVGSGAGGLTNGVNGNQISSANPLLDGLANNGGYTQTRALLSGSPALDKGSAVAGVTTDQRGQARPFDLPGIAPATGGNHSDIGAYEVHFTCSAVTVNPPSLANGTIGVGYLQTLTASGGTAPYTFAVTAGSLPAGLTLASDGTLSGVPTATGTSNFTVTATYTNFGTDCTGSRAYALTINACGGTPTFTVNHLGDASDANPGDGVCQTAGGVCTLRAAVEEINALSACNNIINFSVTGAVSLSAIGDMRYGPSALGINRMVTINGSGAGGVVIERNTSVTRLRLFYISPVGNLTLNNVTLQNGRAQGGNGGTGGRSAGGGAGLGGAIFNEGTLNLNRSTLTANSAQGGNGGAQSAGAQGSGGGGMGADGGNGGGVDGANGGGPNGGLGAVATGAGGNGGAGGGGGGGKGTIPTGNGGDGGFGGGGGSSGSNGFGGNGGFGAGGGSGSSAGGGNDTGGFGGGNGGGNVAGGGGAGLGGAIFNNYQGVITITNSTVSANTVAGGTGNSIGSGSAFGSGLFNRNGTVTIVSSTFNDSVYHLGAANLDHAGGASRSGGSLTLLGSIITTCNNNGGTVTAPLENRNLIQTNSDCGTPALTINPQLAPLANYGGQTWTHALLNDSPAINAGSNAVTGAPYNLTTDQTGQPRQASGTVDIGAYESQLTLSPVSLPNATAGMFYSQTITAAGGSSPYNFAVTSGTLPTGLSLSAGGVLSGTPSPAGGPFDFVVTATDSGGRKGSRRYNTITICGTVSSSPASLSNATFGVGYSQALTGTGGTAPYSFAVTGGALPSGMMVTQDGVLRGSPVTMGTANFTVTITDVNGCSGTRSYSLLVNANSCSPSAITVTSTADSGAGSLRQAIADICGGGVITIQPGLGTISLSTAGDFSFGPTALAIVNKAVTINGNGAIIQRDSGAANLRLFYIDPTGNLILQNVTLRNGLAKGGDGAGRGGGGAGLGGAIVNHGNLFVQNSTLSANQALGGNGGASGGGGGGGGMGFNGGTSSGGGGGGGGGRSGNGGNGASNGGAGGLPVGGGGQNGTDGEGGFTGGAGNTGGGGGAAGNSGARDSGHGGDGGFGGGGGGGGTNGFGSAVGNAGRGGFGGGGGGGASAALGQASGGGAGGFGGGGGGGAANRNGGTGGFAGGSGGNNAGAGGGGAGLGGAIFNYLGSVTIINSTLSGNTAQGGNGGNGTDAGSAGGSGLGGGVFNYNGRLTVVAATLSDNLVVGGSNGTPAPASPAAVGGGGIYNLGDGAMATLSLISSIIANSSSGASDCASSILSSGAADVTGNNNLIESNSGCGSPAVTSDPLLGALQDNGGFTFTQALQAGSPAINTGDNGVTSAPYSLTTDQRGAGFVRQNEGTVDIGAFETQVVNSAPTISAQTGISRQQGSAGANAQIATVGDAESGAAGVTVTVTSANPANGVTLSNIVNTNGTVTADIVAGCTASNASFTLQASDGDSMTTATLNITVTANTAPTLAYGNVSVGGGGSTSNSPAMAGDNGGIASYAVQSTGTYTGMISVNGAGVVSFANAAPAGMHTITIRATDNCGAITDASFTLTVNCPTIIINPSSLSNGTQGAPYSTNITAAGGTAPHSFAVTLGSVPTGLTLNGNGTWSGTASTPGMFSFTVTATDANGCTAMKAYTLTINCPTIIINPSSLSNGTIGVPYTTNITAAGGATPHSFAVTLGGVPTGLTLNSNGTWSGTPTASGMFNFTVTATDANGCTAMKAYTLTINCSPVTVNPSSLPNGTAGVPYTTNITASGGTTPHSFAVTMGSVPTGLTLNSNGTWSGAPTASGMFNFTVTATAANGCTGSRAYTLTVNCSSITVNPSSLSDGTTGVAYSTNITATGGTTPHSFAVTTGTLPAGLTLNSNGTWSGAPTASGMFSFTVTATDANGCTGNRAYTLNINCATVTVSPSSLPNGTQGATYSTNITAAGGAAPHSFAVTMGSVPTGLTLNGNGTWSGTASTPGMFSFTITATDANGCTGSRAYTLTINCATITVNPPSLPDGTVGAAYSTNITASGGTTPHSFAVTLGSVPTGLTLNSNGTWTGAPTASGMFSFTVTATDANGCTGNRAYTLTVNCSTITVNPSSLPNGTTGVTYSTNITAFGGAAPHSFAVTLGSVPTGLTLNSNGTWSGTASASGTSTFTVTATDANGCTGSREYTLTINCSSITVNPFSLPDGTTGVAYSTNITASGGTTPHSFAVTMGSLPAGLTLNSNGTWSGAPTASGMFNFTVTATAANGCTGNRAYTLNINCATITVNPSFLPDGTVGAAYSTNITTAGGVAPHSFAVTTGTAPTGLTLNSNGTWSGTASASGTSTFTVTATDANGCTGSREYTLTVNCPTITVNPTTLPDGTVGAAYSTNITTAGGVAPHSFAVTTGTAPTGLTLNSNGTWTGAPTATGTFTFTVTATDANDCAGSRAYTVTIDPPPPTVGNYAPLMVALSGNTMVAPAAAPTSTTNISVAASTNFKGTLSADPTSGVVRVTNAHPAGTYTITVKAFNSVGVMTTKTFALIVQPGTVCAMPIFSGAADVNVGEAPAAVALGDFNGDGHQDIAVANADSDNASIRLGDGAGNFTNAPNVSVGDNPQGVAVGDFNGDGRQDLAIANLGSHTVSIRLGDGAGNFSGSVNVSVGNNPQAIAVADFDNDGHQDLAVTGTAANAVSLRFGDGAGNFSGTTEIGVGVSPQALVIGDFNNDGNRDFATANTASDNLSIRLGDGAGNFTNAPNVSVGDAPQALALGDFNNDGKQDLAVANQMGAPDVAIRLGDGTGNFTNAPDVSVGSNPRFIAVGDFNNDGNQDLAVATFADTGSIAIRQGDGAGNFNGSLGVAVALPVALAVGDFNGDGRQDFVSAGSMADQIAVRLGGCNSAPTIVAAPTIIRQQASGGAAAVIATVNDTETPRANLLVTATMAPTGLAVTSISAPNATTGEVTATVAADCTASIGANTVTLTVTDGEGAAANVNLTVNVTANTPPMLSYAAVAVSFGGAMTNSPTAAADNGLITAYAVESQGTYTGTISINAAGIVSLSNAAPAGAHTITIRATDNCGDTTDTTFTVNVSCPSTVVTNGNDSGAGSLRQVIADACPDSTITFQTGVTTVILTTAQLVINKNLTIVGGSGVTVTRSTANGTPNFRIFHVESGTVAISHLTVSNGNDAGQAGGIYNGGTLSLTACVITGNTSPQAGGLQNDNVLTMTDCTVSHNFAPNFAGGLKIFGASTTLTNCTFSDNRAGLDSSAIESHTGVTLTVTNCTIANNQAGSGAGVTGGALIANNGTTLRNTIVANNTGNNANIAGTVNAANSFNNLIGESGTGGLTNGVNGNQVGVTNANTLLAALGNYGGATQTCALLPGSPAINAGTATGAPTTDQRGIARLGNTDIGAFESQGFSLALSSGDKQSAAVNTAFANALSVLVNSGFGEPVNGGRVTFTPPGSGASANIAGNPASISGGVATSGAVTANAVTGGPYIVAATAVGAAAGVNFSLTNTCQAITVNPATFATGASVNVFFSQSFTQTGGIGAINWSLLGAPPPGLNFDAKSATLSGTPTASGSFSVTIRATDANDCSGERTLTLQVCAALVCPANLTVATDANQCQAVVNFTTPTMSAGCGTVMCSPASGSVFPKGVTTVTCTVNPGGSSCSFTVMVTDNQPPVLNCPANLTLITPAAAQTVMSVTYATPTATDNCAGVGVVCTPASGASFPVGATTVMCTATDASGNTASCSFTVTIFNVRLQDDAVASRVLLFNSLTGDYRFCHNGAQVSGRGGITQRGSDITLTHNTAERRLTASYSGALKRGNASLQMPPSAPAVTINDRNTDDNTMLCAAP